MMSAELTLAAGPAALAPDATEPATPDRQASPLAAPTESMDELQERIRFDLLPMLRALELLTNSIRVLRVVQAVAGIAPGFRADLTRWCPDWSDPLASGGGKSPDVVVLDLARLAADTGHDLAGTRGAANV